MCGEKVVKKQKTYSFPIAVAEWLIDFQKQNRDELELLGINSEAKLLEVLARNGEIALQELLKDLKVKRESRTAPSR